VPEHRPAVDAGHDDVENHEIGPALTEALDGGEAAVRQLHLVAGLFEQLGFELSHERLVLHDQHRPPPREHGSSFVEWLR
jgi:hypothetical protein